MRKQISDADAEVARLLSIDGDKPEREDTMMTITTMQMMRLTRVMMRMTVVHHQTRNERKQLYQRHVVLPQRQDLFRVVRSTLLALVRLLLVAVVKLLHLRSHYPPLRPVQNSIKSLPVQLVHSITEPTIGHN